MRTAYEENRRYFRRAYETGCHGWESSEPSPHVARNLTIVASSIAGRRLLDLGCGEGRHCLLAARIGFLPTGVDYEPRALVRAQASAHQAGLGGRVRWVAADVFALPLAPGSFDVVVDYSAFHSPRPAPRTIRRHEMRPRTPATAGRLFHSPPAASL